MRVHLAEDKNGILLSVEDDGAGFSAGETQSGMGLKGMAERVRALNGQFRVENLPQGVRISALLPRAREMADA